MKRTAVVASTAVAVLALPASAAAWPPLDVCRAGQIVQVDQDRAVHKVLKPGDTIGACPAPVVQTVERVVPGPERIVPGLVVEKVKIQRRVVTRCIHERTGRPTSCRAQRRRAARRERETAQRRATRTGKVPTALAGRASRIRWSR